MKLDRRLHRALRPVRHIHVLTGVLAGLLGAATVGWAWVLAAGIDRVFLQGEGLDAAGGWLLAFALLGLVRAALRYGVDLAGEQLAAHGRASLRGQLLDHIARLGPAWSGGERAGELSATLTEGIEALRAYYAQFLPQLYQAAVIPLLLLVVVFPRDPYSGLLFALTAPLIPVFMVFIGEHAKQRVEAQYVELGRMSSFFLEVLGGLPTLKALGRARAQLDEVETISRAYGEANLKVLRVAFVSALALELLATLSVALVAVSIGLRLVSGSLDYVDGLFVLIVAPEYYQPLRALGASFHASMSGVEAARRIFAILETAPVRPGEGAQALPEGALALEGVSYRYPGAERPALDGVELRVGPGETLAIVGPSGAGKSTLTKLLLRLVDPDQGRLSLGGVDARELPLEPWRRRVGWVPQEPHLFHGTIGENVRLGAPHAPAAAVWEALRRADLAPLVEGLPLGLQTQVGEGGARLSGGQAQRLALARAFLIDPPILVLDEHTSSLDPDSEDRLGDTLAELARGRTVILCAHRLHTAMRADRVAVMVQGRVVEQGTHQELLAAEGVYAGLIAASGGAE
ncbi:MAG: thiol reductant ABC exporter subunit CydD [Deltaproteobacteria bacterium]|nr:thiol reductant ABC exporter subunit CydD [Deltaproteobacteria bacterium]